MGRESKVGVSLIQTQLWGGRLVYPGKIMVLSPKRGVDIGQAEMTEVHLDQPCLGTRFRDENALVTTTLSLISNVGKLFLEHSLPSL